MLYDDEITMHWSLEYPCVKYVLKWKIKPYTHKIEIQRSLKHYIQIYAIP